MGEINIQDDAAELPIEFWDESSKADEYFEKGYEVVLSGEGDDLFKYLYSRKNFIFEKYLQKILASIDEKDKLNDYLLAKAIDYFKSLNCALSDAEIKIFRQKIQSFIKTFK